MNAKRIEEHGDRPLLDRRVRADVIAAASAAFQPTAAQPNGIPCLHTIVLVTKT
jgi:hypothetical protein